MFSDCGRLQLQGRKSGSSKGVLRGVQSCAVRAILNALSSKVFSKELLNAGLLLKVQVRCIGHICWQWQLASLTLPDSGKYTGLEEVCGPSLSCCGPFCSTLLLGVIGKPQRVTSLLQKLLESGLDAKADGELIKGLGEILGRT